jgi:hypothetical protein
MKLSKQEQNKIINFITDNYSGYFITLQLPPALKTRSKDITEQYFKYILSKFEKHLQGGSEAWIKHPYSFMGFYENLFEQGTYHLHILGSFINPKTNKRVPIEEMNKAIEKANRHFMRRYKQIYGLDYDIQLARNMKKTSKYCIKELIFKGFVDSDRILISDLLFIHNTKYKNPKKRQTKARLKHKTTNQDYARLNIKYKISIKYSVQMVKDSKYNAWTKTRKRKPSEQELQQKAMNSIYNKNRINTMHIF